MEGKRIYKRKTGVVKSNAMDKSVTVMVERMVLEPRFKKYVRRRSKFMAHDAKNECRKGDHVAIRECRPLSKRKRWRVDEVLKRSSDID